MKATIRNDAPTSKVRSVDTPMLTRVRNDAPFATTRNTDVPTARSRYSGVLSQAFETAAQSFAGAGYLIGMLGLTYHKTQEVPATSTSATFKSDDIPTVRIRNTD